VSDQIHETDRISRLLHTLPEPDMEISKERVLQRLQWTIEVRNAREYRTPWWQIDVHLPLPAAVAAAAVILVFAYLVIGPIHRDSMTDIARALESVDIRVHVDAEHTTELLDWLNSQEVGNITIQLPDNAEFSLQGEPVLLRPEQLMIEPVFEEAVRE